MSLPCRAHMVFHPSRDAHVKPYGIHMGTTWYLHGAWGGHGVNFTTWNTCGVHMEFFHMV